MEAASTGLIIASYDDLFLLNCEWQRFEGRILLLDYSSIEAVIILHGDWSAVALSPTDAISKYELTKWMIMRLSSRRGRAAMRYGSARLGTDARRHMISAGGGESRDAGWRVAVRAASRRHQHYRRCPPRDLRRQCGSSVGGLLKGSTWIEMTNEDSSSWRPRFGDQQ